MAKSGVGSRGSKTGQATKARIVAAAIETLKTDGFAGASARAIAKAGGFNQALVFYHFGSVNSTHGSIRAVISARSSGNVVLAAISSASTLM